MKEIKNTYSREADACLPADVFFSLQTDTKGGTSVGGIILNRFERYRKQIQVPPEVQERSPKEKEKNGVTFPAGRLKSENCFRVWMIGRFDQQSL